jgi:RND superfamily putative drug exporter
LLRAGRAETRLVDAFLVRMTLVPAVMTLLGKSGWYLPRWLDKILPDVDIEGAKLLARLSPAGPDELAPAESGRGKHAEAAPDPV